MDEPLAKAYADLEDQIKDALEQHRGQSLGYQHGAECAAALSRPSLRTLGDGASYAVIAGQLEEAVRSF